MPPLVMGLPPQEDVTYFRDKGLLESFAWPDVWQEEHAKAFTVAKAMRRDILQDIYEAVDRALTDGTTLETFRKELTPLLQAKGWWGRQEATDPLTGEIRNVQLGSPRRLETIFDVNLRSAYQAGRWERIERTKAALPFLRYVAVQDGRTRPEHRAWHGTVLPADDPWWDTHYPPCGWRCRCTVTQATAGMLERRGWAVTETPPRGAPRLWRNPRTGETIVVETGIDPGFAYNVGKAHLRALAPSPVSPPPADGQAENAGLA
ncbi:MAG TPA: phage minor head protein, partial [Caulobacter sp.]|nr:phage minor head protein [Caulobacter sp.]